MNEKEKTLVLTALANYTVELLNRRNRNDLNRTEGYLNLLDEKITELKKLIEKIKKD